MNLVSYGSLCVHCVDLIDENESVVVKYLLVCGFWLMRRNWDWD